MSVDGDPGVLGDKSLELGVTTEIQEGGKLEVLERKLRCIKSAGYGEKARRWESGV